MDARIDFAAASPEGLEAMRRLERHVEWSALDEELLELVRLRASQINGCAYCIDMHTKDARAAGETEQRLYGLTAWREAPYYTARERAALDWTEALTRIGEAGVPDDLYARVLAHFSEEDMVDLSLAVVAINGWNRLAISFRKPPGTYRPAGHAAAVAE